MHLFESGLALDIAEPLCRDKEGYRKALGLWDFVKLFLRRLGPCLGSEIGGKEMQSLIRREHRLWLPVSAAGSSCCYSASG